jgi:hypothetical protein
MRVVAEAKPTIAAPTGRDQAQVVADIETQRAALAGAEREIDELQRRRCEMLTIASVDEVLDIDTILSRAAAKIDIAQARIVALEGELERFRAAARDAHLAANLARAQQLAEEARQLIVGDYVTAATAIVEVLFRLDEIRAEVAPLNRQLPPGVDGVQVEPPRYASATLATAVKLPGVDAYADDFWPARPH